MQTTTQIQNTTNRFATLELVVDEYLERLDDVVLESARERLVHVGLDAELDGHLEPGVRPAADVLLAQVLQAAVRLDQILRVGELALRSFAQYGGQVAAKLVA